MADTTEKIIFEVDASSWEKSLANIASDIDALKQTQKSLLEQARAGSAEAAIEYQKVTAALKVQEQQYRTTQAVVVGYYQAQLKGADANNFANNSIEQNRALLKQLTAQYIQTVKPTQEFTDKVKRLSDTLKEQEGAIGDTRRNVGNYASSIVDAFKNLSVAGVNVGGIIEPLKKVNQSFKDAGGGASGLAAGLSTGLGGALPLVVLGLSGLLDSLKTYKPLADAAENATLAITAGFNALVTGGNVVEAARQTIEYTEALRDLEDTQASFNLSQQESTNRVNQLLLVSKNVGLDIGQRLDILKEAEQIERNQFRESQRRAEETIKANENIIRSIGRLTEKQFIQFTNGSTQARLEIQTLLEQRGVQEDVIKRFQQALIEQAKLTGESIALREKIANRRSALLEKQEAENEKELEKERQHLEKLKREREAYLKNLEDLETQFLLNDRERLAKSFNDKIASIKGNTSREITLRLAIAQDRDAALDKFDKEQQDKRDRAAAEREAKRLAEISKTFNEAIQLNQAIADNEIAKIDLTTATLEEKEKAKQKILLDSLEKQLQLTEAYFGEDGVITDIEKASLERLRILIQKTAADINKETGGGGTLGSLLGVSDTEIKKAKDGLSNAEQITNSIGGLVSSLYAGQIQDIENKKNAEIEAIEASGASEEEKDKRRQEAEKRAALDAYEVQKSQFEVNKAISIVQTIINTAAAIVAQLTNPTPYVGIALSALAAATGAAQIGVIAAQQPPPPPRFAEGVIGLDGAGTETSDSIPAYLSKGESVVTAKATRRFHRELAQMELAVGNQPNYQFGKGKFATGIIGVPNVVTGDGGFSSRDIANTIQQTQLLASINTSLQNMPTPVVSVKEITKVTNKRNQSVSVSEL